MSHKGWIAVDLDGTLAHYDGWKGSEHIGEPVPEMLKRVKAWLLDGHDVRIFTARVSPVSCKINNESVQQVKRRIEDWCMTRIGRVLPITHEKDLSMVELWDDRCVQVIPNTGLRADGKE